MKFRIIPFESTEEQSSEASDDSFHSTNDDFLQHDENLEPMANKDEAAAYVELVAWEEEKEVLWSWSSISYIFVAYRVKFLSCTVHLIFRRKCLLGDFRQK